MEIKDFINILDKYYNNTYIVTEEDLGKFHAEVGEIYELLEGKNGRAFINIAEIKQRDIGDRYHEIIDKLEKLSEVYIFEQDLFESLSVHIAKIFKSTHQNKQINKEIQMKKNSQLFHLYEGIIREGDDSCFDDKDKCGKKLNQYTYVVTDDCLNELLRILDQCITHHYNYSCAMMKYNNLFSRPSQKILEGLEETLKLKEPHKTVSKKNNTEGPQEVTVEERLDLVERAEKTFSYLKEIIKTKYFDNKSDEIRGRLDDDKEDLDSTIKNYKEFKEERDKYPGAYKDEYVKAEKGLRATLIQINRYLQTECKKEVNDGGGAPKNDNNTAVEVKGQKKVVLEMINEIYNLNT